MEQTAVEWLMPKILELTLQLSLRKISARNCELEIANLFDQAKAMEKEQSLKMLPYDLDELAEGYANYMNNDNGTSDIDFKEGFQKALELLTFKSE